MLDRRFLSLKIYPDQIQIGLFGVKNNVLNVFDLRTFSNKEELRKYLVKKGLKYTDVVGSLGGIHVLARSITLSSVGRVDFDREIVKSIKEQIPLYVDEENLLIEYQVLSSRQDRVKETVDVLAAITKKSSVFEYLEMLRGLDLNPVLIDAGNTSLFLPFLQVLDKDVSTAIVDVGREKSDVVVVQEELPYFVSKLDLGDEGFSKNRSVFFKKLQSILDFYDAEEIVTRKINKMVVTGRNQEAVRKYLKKKFDFPVQTSDLAKNPMVNLRGSFKDLSTYALPIGLGLKKIYPALSYINLIPDQEKESIGFFSLKRNLKNLSIILASVFGIAAIALLSANLLYSFRISSISGRMKGLKTKLDQVYQLRNQNKLLRQKLSRIEPLLSEETVWDRVLFEIAKLTPKDVWLVSLESDSKLKKKDNGIEKEKILYVEGKAIEERKIDRFISRLEDSPQFSSVQIEEIEKKEVCCFKLKLMLK
jgi:Tfp pilus assembly PilM family ATPase/Tfp pilus assembly protein PilN